MKPREKDPFLYVCPHKLKGVETQQYVVFLGSDISGFRKRGSSYISLEDHGWKRASDESVSVLSGQEIILIFWDVFDCVLCCSMLEGKEFGQGR